MPPSCFSFHLSAVFYLSTRCTAPNLLCENGVSGKFRQVHELQVQRPKFSQDAAPGRRPSPVPTGATVTEGEAALWVSSPTPCARATRNHGNKPTMWAGTKSHGWLESWQQDTKKSLSVVKWQNRDKDAGMGQSTVLDVNRQNELWHTINQLLSLARVNSTEISVTLHYNGMPNNMQMKSGGTAPTVQPVTGLYVYVCLQ